jgi:hypothetical protein
MADFGDDKGITSKSMEMTKGGSSYTSGPTGSSRSYPKGGKGPSDSQDASQFNPQRAKVSDIYVGGVD